MEKRINKDKFLKNLEFRRVFVSYVKFV